MVKCEDEVHPFQRLLFSQNFYSLLHAGFPVSDSFHVAQNTNIYVPSRDGLHLAKGQQLKISIFG